MGLVNSFWVSVWSYTVQGFSLFFRYLFRFAVEKNVTNWSENDDHGVKHVEEFKKNMGFDQIEENEISMSNSERQNNVYNASMGKYQFFSGNSVCSFIEEPENDMNFTVHEMFVFPNNGFASKHDFVEKVDSFFEGKIQGFSVDRDDSISHDVILEPFLVKKYVCDCVEIENSVCDSRCDDHVLVENDCHDLLREEKEVVEQGETGSSVSCFRCDDRGLVHNDVGGVLSGEEEVVERGKTENSDCGFTCNDHILEHNDCDDLVTGEEEVVEQRGKTENSGCGFRCDDLKSVHNDCDNLLIREEEVIEPGIRESPFAGDVNCGEKDASSISQDELSEKEETFSLDEILEKVEFSDQVHSLITNNDDFWSTIYQDDCVFGSHDEINIDYEEYCLNSLDDSSIDANNVSSDDVSLESDLGEVDSPFIELDPNSHTSTVHTEEHVPTAEFPDSDSEHDQESLTHLDELTGIDSTESCDEGDVQLGNDVLLEQKELIRQMKKEMRQLKVNGLPTILEESESPRVEDDLRPLRIDERIGHKDRMDEILIFHKRYSDKMRKLDILSQQTMYAIGLLQLKNEDQLVLNKKMSVPVMKSLLAQNFWSHKLRKHEADSVHKIIKDLRRQLELVYVGQLCLSWEMLKWQHQVEELRAHDPDGFRQYNHVAGEFQKFQVLLQRFTEDEPFNQGPRVQHYLKTRCGHLNLLQVPLIKDDPRSEWRGDREGAISISMLKEVIASSMRSFWDFLHADKDEVHGITLMGIHGVHVDLQDPSDTDLVTEIRSNLHKKEKRLKDLVRSGNCIVRKFHKRQEQRLSPEMFLAQVELRLVSRVLNMPKLTTEQLLWCHKKMNKTNIIGRKVYIESSFLLFPC